MVNKSNKKSNWEIRNNSNNITAVLHPKITVKTQNTKTIQKTPLDRNKCHCYETKIKPTLLPHPKQCISEDTEVTRWSNCICYKLFNNINSEYSTNSCYCSCFHNLDDSEDADKSRTNSKCPRNDSESDKHTKNLKRRHYSRQRKNTDKDTRKLPSQNANQPALNKHHLKGKSRQQAITDNKDQGSQISQDNEQIQRGSTSQNSTSIPSHQCIHEFRLNSRMVPIPRNTDRFNRSLCIICNKPMDDFGKNRMVSVDCPINNADLEQFSKIHAIDYKPKSITIGNSSSNIAVKLNNDVCNLDNIVRKMKRLQYTNSLALRQQRMSY